VKKSNGINEKLFPALQNILETPKKCVYNQIIFLLVTNPSCSMRKFAANLYMAGRDRIPHRRTTQKPMEALAKTLASGVNN